MTVKAVLISEGGALDLTAHVAGLDLPRRASSLPLDPSAEKALPSFIELWGEPDRLREAVAGWPFRARAWLVSEHVPIAYDRSWPSGTPSPGVRMISAIYRRPGMSRSDFKRYWWGPHAEIAKAYTVPVWNYSQNVVSECLTEDAEEDGFVGMHFRSAEDLRARWQDHPDEAARGARDAAKFMRLDRPVSMTAVETVWESEPIA